MLAGTPGRVRPPLRRAAPHAETAGDGLLRALLVAYLCTMLLEGPLRWLLALAGIPEVLYARDAIPLLSIAWLAVRPLATQGRIDPVLAVPACVLLVHGAIGLLLGLAPFQVAFGFKIFMVVVYGMAMWPLLHARWDAVGRVAAVLFAITFTGVALNFVAGRLPWEGLAYDSAFGTLSTTRQWWIQGGISRLSGFTRASFNAAMILGLTGVVTMATVRRGWVRVLVALLGLAAIAGTTSKGMLLAYPLAALWLCWGGPGRHPAAGRVLVLLLAGFALLLPLAMVLLELGHAISPAHFPSMLVSVWDRFSWMWPTAFELLERNGSWLSGAGLGGIGTPQQYGTDPGAFNAGDSFAVFLIVNFGVAGIAYYLLAALLLRRASRDLEPRVAAAVTGLLVVAYGYGLSISMVEETSFAVAWGACLGVCLRSLWPQQPGAR